MNQGLCLVVLASWAAVVWAADKSYCDFTPQHTLCKYSGVGPKCGKQMQMQVHGVKDHDAAKIVAKHNQLRSKVAMRQEMRGKPGPQPGATNMRLMEWDGELAQVAQAHADQCVFQHDCSDCRRVARFGVGQNLFISFQSNLDTSVQWERAIQAWYDEVALFSPGHIQPFKFSKGVGHYTQMMWWSTYKIGCGFTMFKESKWWKKLYTCNYGPAGNIISSQMYQTGSPCSSCPDGTTCSLQYPGLCHSAFGSSLTTNQVLVRRTFAPKTLAKTMRPSPADLEQGSEPGDADDEQDATFIPFTGAQPTTSDLMPFLRRAGMNTQIIRTSSLANVHNIIDALPPGHRPIVLFRSGSGQLTELNPKTLVPLQRSSRSTTTRGPGTTPPALLACDLDFLPCEIVPIGGNWTVAESESEGQYMEVTLQEGEGAQVVVQQLVAAPESETVCVTLSHRRALTATYPTDATIPPLQVGVMPLGETITRRPVLGAPGVWEMSRVTLQGVKSMFMLAITVGPASAPATVGLGALMVTNGECCLSGQC